VVDIIVSGGLEEEAGLGFTAVADLFIPGEECVGVMETIIFRIEGGVTGGKLSLHLFTNSGEGLCIEMAFGQAGLVGNKDDEKAELVELVEGGGDAGEESELRHGEGRVDDTGLGVVDELVDDAVTIKEDGLV
jgi:hypothetical protein